MANAKQNAAAKRAAKRNAKRKTTAKQNVSKPEKHESDNVVSLAAATIRARDNSGKELRPGPVTLFDGVEVIPAAELDCILDAALLDGDKEALERIELVRETIGSALAHQYISSDSIAKLPCSELLVRVEALLPDMFQVDMLIKDNMPNRREVSIYSPAPDCVFENNPKHDGKYERIATATVDAIGHESAYNQMRLNEMRNPPKDSWLTAIGNGHHHLLVKFERGKGFLLLTTGGPYRFWQLGEDPAKTQGAGVFH